MTTDEMHQILQLPPLEALNRLIRKGFLLTEEHVPLVEAWLRTNHAIRQGLTSNTLRLIRTEDGGMSCPTLN